MEGSAVESFSRPFLALARRQRRFIEEYLLRRPPERAWATPNRIAVSTPAYRLRLFEAEAEGRDERRPVLVVPPEVNHSSIVDFAPEQSLVATIGRGGFPQVAAIEWRSARPETARRDIDDSVEAILRAAEHLGRRVHLVGVCQGGWEAAIAAALRPERCASLTLVAAPLDFWAGAGKVKNISRLVPMSFFDTLVAAGGGVARGGVLSFGFDSLMPFERFVLKPLRVWNNIEDDEWMERFGNLEDWYRSPKDLPGPLYLRAVYDLFKHNKLVRGKLRCLGEQVDLARVTCPCCLIAGDRDHITPPPQVFATRRYLGSDEVLEVQTRGGHVGAFIGRTELRERWPIVLDWLAEVDRRDRAS